MPPANSPTNIHTADASTSPFFELEALAGPVPDLASTLTTTQAELEANDAANVSFLRTPIDDDDSTPSTISENSIDVLRRQIRAERENRATDRNDSESQRRMRLAQTINQRRYSPSELHQLQDRPPSTTQRPSSGYYGWAPPSEDGRSDSEHWSGLPTMSTSSAEFYDEQRRALLSAARHIQSSSRDPSTATARGGGSSETSLRTAALLQSVRRNPQSSARSRNSLQSHLQERERSGLESTLRDPSSASDPRRRSALGSRSGRHREQSESQMASTLHDLARRDWILSGYQRQQEEELRRRQEGSEWHLEDAIKYLERLRFCDSYQESVSSAAAGGFVREEFFTTNHDDFILDTAMINPPAQSSWLKVGGIFSGSQHATNGTTYFLRDRSSNQGARASNLPQLGQAPALPSNRHSFTYTAPTSAAQTPSRQARHRVPLGTYENLQHSPRQFRTALLNSAAERTFEQPSATDVSEERWPVKVKIHSVNYENMTLAGTMEAFNVPDKSSLSQVSSITTFLEGEIIDFNLHTLETKNYKTDENTDSIYWRMLEPFKKMTDDEMVRGLVSKKWMREQLHEKYILMRWKGEHSDDDVS
ncbi:MAG: hypothetical protein Q9219_003900 [cf. Caloplaca sp. 3 TL-2023]